MTPMQAMTTLQSKVESAALGSVHIFCFNIFEEELEAAYSLLDKEEQRRAMRVTYSNDSNFIVRFVPSAMHNVASAVWTQQVTIALLALIPNGLGLWGPLGCMPIGRTGYQLGRRQKQADAGFEPTNSDRPSIVLEVGCSESLRQLKIDARLWLEHLPDVQLVILLSIDPPAPPHPTPEISIELWQGVPSGSQTDSRRVARMVWDADWTHHTDQFYILLADIFRGQVPPDYGANDRIFLNPAAWRQAIIAAYR